MPPDKIKFKQIADEFRTERMTVLLRDVQTHLDNNDWDAAEKAFSLLLQDLRRLGWAKEIADK